jgi:phosphatidylserine/phosphatidylglycerophosphate/cardiolipin synthase-like enzyme
MKFITITVRLIIWSVFVLVPHAGAEMIVQTCFSPQGRCSAHILREIDLAKKELLIAVYAFTSSDLANAVIQAKRRGVSIRVVVDREFDRANENSKARFLEMQEVPIKRVSGSQMTLPDKEPGLMHQKFAIIDRRLVFTGSYNWTHSAENRNDENLLMFRNAAPLAEEYRRTFFKLWERKS